MPLRAVLLALLLTGLCSSCVLGPAGRRAALTGTCRQVRLTVDAVRGGDVNTMTLRARVTSTAGTPLADRYVTMALELPGLGTTLQLLTHTSGTDADGYAYNDLGADVLTNTDVAKAVRRSGRLWATYQGTDAKVKQDNGVNACEAHTTVAFKPDQRAARLPDVGTPSRAELTDRLGRLQQLFQVAFGAEPDVAPRLPDGRSACRELVGLIEYVKAQHPEWLDMDTTLAHARNDCSNAWGLTALDIDNMLDSLTGRLLIRP